MNRLASRPGSNPALPPHPHRQGFVLVAVLVFVFLLSMIVASLLFQSAADETAAAASAGSEQAWAAAMSGVAELLRIAPEAGGPELDWQDNPRRFKHQLVFEDGADQWFFTAFTPADPDSLAEIRYGLADTASRLHLPSATIDQLVHIPRITPDLARTLRAATGLPGTLPPATSTPPPDAALPIDPSGTDQPQDPSSPPPPIHNLEDLLALPGLSPALLLGEDLNQNGRLEPAEDANQDGSLDRGLAQFLTLVAITPNASRDGRRRTRLNDPSDPLPDVPLPPAFTNYLAAVRTARVRIDHPAALLDATSRVKGPDGAETEIPSGISRDELPIVLDLFTGSDDTRPEQGLINLNTASATVLATIPGIDEALAASIVSSRTSLSPDRRHTTAWLVQEGTVTPELFRSIAPHLTARSHQFTCRVAGYGLPSGRFRILEVHIDTSSGKPGITQLRDVSRSGFPLILSESDTPSGTSTPTGAWIPFHRRSNDMARNARHAEPASTPALPPRGCPTLPSPLPPSAASALPAPMVFRQRPFTCYPVPNV